MDIYLKLGNMIKTKPIKLQSDNYSITGHVSHDPYNNITLTEVKLNKDYLFMQYEGKDILSNMGVIKKII